jgi:hypothetical protein
MAVENKLLQQKNQPPKLAKIHPKNALGLVDYRGKLLATLMVESELFNKKRGFVAALMAVDFNFKQQKDFLGEMRHLSGLREP